MTQLRERSNVILWLLLFFFVASMTVGGLVGGANIMTLIVGGQNINLNAGRINGKDISHTTYQNQREIQLNRLRRQGQTIDNRAYQNAGDFAWNTIIERELKDQKIKELGLEVSLDEIYEVQCPEGMEAGERLEDILATYYVMAEIEVSEELEDSEIDQYIQSKKYDMKYYSKNDIKYDMN